MPIAEAEITHVEKALYAQLLAMPEVVSLIAETSTGPAISPINAAQRETLPRITYQLLSDVPPQGLKGKCCNQVATFQLKCWAKTPALATQIAKAITGRKVNPRLADFTWQDGLLGGLLHAAQVKVVDGASEIELPSEADEPEEYWHLLVVVVQYYDP